MALSLLDGTNALIDFKIAATGTNQVSVKCAFNFLSCRFVKGFTEKTTFCTGGWVSEQGGMKQALIHLDGFASKGEAWSDPIVFINATAPMPFTFTADTGCTISGSANCAGDGIDLRAAANSGRGIDLRSDGAVTVVWVVA